MAHNWLNEQGSTIFEGSPVVKKRLESLNLSPPESNLESVHVLVCVGLILECGHSRKGVFIFIVLGFHEGSLFP